MFAQSDQIERAAGKWDYKITLYKNGIAVKEDIPDSECIGLDETKTSIIDLALKLSVGKACNAVSIVRAPYMTNFVAQCPDNPDFDGAAIAMKSQSKHITVTATLRNESPDPVIKIVNDAKFVGQFCTEW